MAYYDLDPRLFLLAIHDTLVVGFYLHTTGPLETVGEHQPHFELEIGPEKLSGPFLDHFNYVWKGAIEDTQSGEDEP